MTKTVPEVAIPQSLKLDLSTEGAICAYLEAKFKTLDDVKADRRLAGALGLSDRERDSAIKLAARLVGEDYLSPDVPKGQRISRPGGNLSLYLNANVVGEAQANKNRRQMVSDYLAGKTLDDVGQAPGLASAVGLPDEDKQSIVKLAARLVEDGYMKPGIPPGHAPLRANGHLSNYLNREVVGEPEAKKNLRQAVGPYLSKRQVRTLDDVGVERGLAVALGLPEDHKLSTTKLAAQLVRGGYLAPELPPGHLLSKSNGRPSLYINGEVVGEVQANQNLRQGVREYLVNNDIKTLDDVDKRRMASALGVLDEERRSRIKFAAQLVQEGYLNPEIPQNHSLFKANGHLSNYIESEVVGEEQARRNLGRAIPPYLEQNDIQTLDDVSPDEALAAALGIQGRDKLSAMKLASKLVQGGYLTPEISEWHPISRRNHLSNYLRPEVVGDATAIRNLRAAIQCRFAVVEDISTRSSITAICNSLGLQPSVPELRAHLLSLGWLPSSTVLGETLPREFLQHPIKHRLNKRVPKLRDKEIGVERVRDPRRDVTFAKGEAFEQLVGLFLAHANSNESLWPQHCLVVDPVAGYFGMRADWRIAKEIVEVKFGGADDNIEDTYKKHKSTITNDFNYRMITLVGNGHRVPTEGFDAAIKEQFQEELFQGVANLIHSFVQEGDSHPEQARRKLKLLRDAMYTVTSEINLVKGDERKERITTLLSDFLTTPPDQLENRLEKLARFGFPPLLATFEYRGVTYRTQITIPEHQREADGKRYSLVYTFAGQRFAQPLDRDMAVMLELSDDLYGSHLTADDALPRKVRLHREPVFTLPDGRKVSSHPLDGASHVSSLDELRKHVTIPDDFYRFGQEYLAECGMRA